MRVKALYIYPIKGCRGIRVSTLEIDVLGPKHDRRFMVVNARGQFVTQRGDPALATVEIEIEGGYLRCSAPGQSVLLVALEGEGESVQTKVWKDSVEAIDVGAHAAGWFTNVLGKPVRLVRIPDGRRQSRGVAVHGQDVKNGFADGFPILMTTAESLDWLNDQLDVPVGMDRFRPNIVLEGAAGPFAEDRFERMRVGDVELLGATLCGRCKVINTDQVTGACEGVRSEPLATLKEQRTIKGVKGPVFGLNVDHLTGGTIREDDELIVESWVDRIAA